MLGYTKQIASRARQATLKFINLIHSKFWNVFELVQVRYLTFDFVLLLIFFRFDFVEDFFKYCGFISNEQYPEFLTLNTSWMVWDWTT